MTSLRSWQCLAASLPSCLDLGGVMISNFFCSWPPNSPTFFQSQHRHLLISGFFWKFCCCLLLVMGHDNIQARHPTEVPVKRSFSRLDFLNFLDSRLRTTMCTVQKASGFAPRLLEYLYQTGHQGQLQQQHDCGRMPLPQQILPNLLCSRGVPRPRSRWPE